MYIYFTRTNSKNLFHPILPFQPSFRSPPFPPPNLFILPDNFNFLTYNRFKFIVHTVQDKFVPRLEGVRV